jgi:proteasome lid subunit RPN8/RPN11
MSLRASERVLRISADNLERIWAHARSDDPWEACGIITTAGRHVPIKNAHTRPHVAYVFDVSDYITVMQEMSASGEKLEVIYHSHSARDSRASGTDQTTVVWAEAFYLIVSTHDDTATAYVWNGRRLTECPLEVVPSISPG